MIIKYKNLVIKITPALGLLFQTAMAMDFKNSIPKNTGLKDGASEFVPQFQFQLHALAKSRPHNGLHLSAREFVPSSSSPLDCVQPIVPNGLHLGAREFVPSSSSPLDCVRPIVPNGLHLSAREFVPSPSFPLDCVQPIVPNGLHLGAREFVPSSSSLLDYVQPIVRNGLHLGAREFVPSSFSSLDCVQPIVHNGLHLGAREFVPSSSSLLGYVQPIVRNGLHLGAREFVPSSFSPLLLAESVDYNELDVNSRIFVPRYPLPLDRTEVKSSDRSSIRQIKFLMDMPGQLAEANDLITLDLKNTKSPLYKNKRDPGCFREIIEGINKINEGINNSDFLDKDQQEIAYDIATSLRHNRNFFDLAEIIFKGIILSTRNEIMQSLCYRGLSKIYSRKEKFEETIEFSKEAIKYNPNDPHNYLWLGNIPKLDIQQRIANLQSALIIAKRQNSNLLQVQAMISLGNIGCIDDLHKTQSAWYNEALILLGDKGNLSLRAQAMIGLGDAQYVDEIHKTPADWYNEALTFLGDKVELTFKMRAMMDHGNNKYI